MSRPIGRGANRGRTFHGGRADLSLQQKIINAYSGAGWTTYCVFLALAEYLNLTASAVNIWTNLGAAGVGDATQGTASAKPVWDPTGLNGKGTLTFDGGDYLQTPTFDVQSETACVLTVLYSDTRTIGLSSPAEYGQVTGGGNAGLLIQTFNTEPYIRTVGSSGGVNAKSATGGISMDTPDVVSSTWDTARTSEECEIRHAGANVTDSYPANGNTASMFPNDYYLNLGGRYTGGGLIGDIVAAVFAAGNTAIPVSAVAETESLLAAEWGV